MPIIEIVISVVIGLAFGAVAAYFLTQFFGRNALVRARQDAQRVLGAAQQDAQNRAKEIELAARQDRLRLKEQFEKEHEATRNELKQHEQRLNKREIRNKRVFFDKLFLQLKKSLLK